MARSEASNPGRVHVPRPDRLLVTLPYVSLLGLVGLVVNALLSFEQPHPGILLASGLATLAAPSASCSTWRPLGN